jgi:hypothetical protein
VSECDCPAEGQRLQCRIPAGTPTGSCQCDGNVCQPTGPTSQAETSCCSCDPNPPPGA